MPSFGQAKSFWKTVREVSVREIVRETERRMAVALVGTPERRAEVMRRLFPDYHEGDVIPERSLLLVFDETSEAAGFPLESGSLDLVIDAGGGRAQTPPGTPIFSVEELGGWDRVVERILDQRPDMAMSLARRFPGLRPAVADRVIKQAALANAEFAMLNALPGVIPILSPLLPATALGDLLVLAKNQGMMLFRLAAIYELPLDPRERSRDLASLVGNAFGWRALAREVVGVVPGGVGMVLRGAIAYAGTAALGKALHRYYATGQQPTRAQINRFYREALEGAKEIARQRLPALQKRITARPAGRPHGADRDEAEE